MMTTYTEDAAFYADDARRSAEYEAAEGFDAYMSEEFGDDWRERSDTERFVPEGEVDDPDEYRDAWAWWEDRLRSEWT